MPRRTAVLFTAAGTALALVVGLSVVWPGLDAQETPAVDGSVWALQTGEGLRYARVNTTIGELDTVRSVSNPSAVVETDAGAYLFSDGFTKRTLIDAAQPSDITDADETAQDSPTGTAEVVTAGEYVAYRTDTGVVYAGRLSDPDVASDPLDPFPGDDEDAPPFAADAVAIDERGMLFAYSAAEAAVVRYDVAAREVRERDVLDLAEGGAPGLTAPAITAAGDDWAVVDTETGDVWQQGADAPARTSMTGPVVVGAPDPDAVAVYLADARSLVRVGLDGSGIRTEPGTGTATLGVPAAPVSTPDGVLAAWLPLEGDAGALWSSAAEGTVPLDYNGEVPDDEPRPSFVVTADAVIVNDTRSGWVWTAPDGDLVVSSQNWSLDDRVDEAAVPSGDERPIVVDPKPPVAGQDAFGVRAGSLATLPVLMNDHDPNKDVLSVQPASVTGLDPAFGEVSLTDDGQRLAVRVAPGARGTAAFSYAVTDGTTAQGLTSEPATVTLTVADPAVGSAPQWCGVDGCLVEWPTPEVAAGGTISVPVLTGWVDPEGDPLLLLGVENTTGVGSVAATPGGDVVYQHSDDGGAGGDGAADTIQLNVTVADTEGQTTVKPLAVRVTPQPELSVQSFVVVDSARTGLTVDVSPHVTGTAGSVRLDSVRVLDAAAGSAAASAVVIGGTTSFDFSAPAAGTYRVEFTVTGNGSTSVTGLARITLVDGEAAADLSTAPVVAFVQPQQDATLDVFTAVSNPTRRVLLLSDVVATADAGATLSVDAVGQSQLRVSGTTASGAAGRLGTVAYVVSDGTTDVGARVAGEATVFLLPPAPELAPIAVDDTVVVRSGSQIDIPVVDNDIAPAGGRPTLDPTRVSASGDGALAFASGDVLRYLAPAEPGEYTIDYGVYTTGSVSLADAARVNVRVIDDEENRPPAPETLEGRVLSGQTVAVAFDGFGMDPDGDVVTLERIVAQPQDGVATISPDGTSLQYTSVAGDAGQKSFTYRAVDAFGQSGEATVNIGVLDEESNPAPVTYTDYVQVQAGADSSVRVSPAANDVDPTARGLTVERVRPDIAPTLEGGEDNPAFVRLQERIRSQDDSTVVIAAGEEPGTMSFLYDVESGSGNTGRGLIVVKVVRESVPDYPIIADTVLTAEDRDRFSEGVDVLTGKGSWSGGDLGDLEVALWGDPGGVSVDGRELSGPVPDRTRLIPFAVTGDNAAGEEITTYAFLRVPGADDVSLSLRAAAAPVEVDEGGSATFDMAALVARPRGRTLEVGTEMRASGARSGSVCVPASGATVRYDAGAGAPWVDACQVPVRLAGQDAWTYLSVRIDVRPSEPQPSLVPASQTVGPGETRRWDLQEMTRWDPPDRAQWSRIGYTVDYSGTAFEVTLNGSEVVVTGADGAPAGVEETVLVSVTGYDDVAPARLVLRAGSAPSVQPLGGSVGQRCSQAGGSSCTVTVVGVPGEVNPLPRTPLEVVDVRPVGACAGVSFEIAPPSSVVATWAADTPGTSCAAAFSVRDAQGRRTNAERDGQLLLDLYGYPRTPASVAQTAYADGSVTLRVDGGEAQLAYPALTGYVIRWQGQVVARCAADGSCPAIGAPNGEERTYDATAVNEVGESASSVRTVAWAYDPPPAPTAVIVEPVQTAGDGGVVSLDIQGIDPVETGAVDVTSPAGETVRVPVEAGRTSIGIPSYRVGTNTRSPITVTPYSRFAPPPGLAGTDSGASLVVEGNGVGAPLTPNLALSSESSGDRESTVTAVGSAASNGDGSQLRYGIVRSGLCRTSDGGATATFPGLDDGEEYSFTLCVESWYDGRSYGRAEIENSVRAVQSGAAPRDWTFVVSPAPDVEAREARWRIRDAPTSPEELPNNNRAEFNKTLPVPIYDQDPDLQVRYVHERWGDATPYAVVVPRAGSAPYQVQAGWRVDACAGGGELRAGGSSTQGRAAITFDYSGAVFRDAANAVVPRTPDTLTVPVGATSVEGIRVTVDWSAQNWGLQSATQTFGGECTANLPPPG